MTTHDTPKKLVLPLHYSTSCYYHSHEAAAGALCCLSFNLDKSEASKLLRQNQYVMMYCHFMWLFADLRKAVAMVKCTENIPL